MLTNGYVILPDLASVTLTINDNFGTNELFTTVATNLHQPTGIDYHSLSNCLIVSQYFQFGGGTNFIRINSDGFVTNWSRVSGLADEVKLAIAKASTNGFATGEMFFGVSNGVIGRISSDAAVSNLNWVTLPGETNALRGSFYFDQTGTFSYDLIAVTGGAANRGGGVWQIHSQTNATRLASINNPQPHLEGVITLTNDSQRWGPWAGKIVTGAESWLDQNLNPLPTIQAIGTNGAVASFALGIAPEDFDVIPTNQDLYVTAFNEGKILKLSKSYLTNYVGDLLITQEGPGIAPKLFIVHWDNSTSNFVTRSISAPSFANQGFEHATFAPINIPDILEP